ncbi:AMP-binding protein [Streptomyces griseus]|uniref:AMP-binding protein n=1 Tax=Streptomyces griseus TaxID=1911 RepID=UPI0033C960B9
MLLPAWSLPCPPAWARRHPALSVPALRADGALRALATAVNGGAALDRGIAAELRTRTGLRIVGAYGMTETTAPAFHQSDASRPGAAAVVPPRPVFPGRCRPARRRPPGTDGGPGPLCCR